MVLDAWNLDFGKEVFQFLAISSYIWSCFRLSLDADSRFFLGRNILGRATILQTLRRKCNFKILATSISIGYILVILDLLEYQNLGFETPLGICELSIYAYNVPAEYDMDDIYISESSTQEDFPNDEDNNFSDNFENYFHPMFDIPDISDIPDILELPTDELIKGILI
ncbi:hypothetical protein RclHR1_05360013 [Rhizophagus clarus]|uniref:Uncharacterized protein n=1 Tax=Rhizophagus clarus TaxID=94130 RepID=A0A2Z6RSN6_9GLOM|nr:hypothetical protein RclHR1_05360013 [Rhizophagus clarus]